MLARAVLAFVALPGLFAYAVPAVAARLLHASARPSPPGVAVIFIGTSLLLWCVAEFHRQGRGTLAPWSPPVRLVQSGPYRFSRNPMYLGVLLVLAGWAVAYASTALGAYAAAVAVAFHLRVVFGEEPALAKAFGEAWRAYTRLVPRWLWPPRRGDHRQGPARSRPESVNGPPARSGSIVGSS